MRIPRNRRLDECGSYIITLLFRSLSLGALKSVKANQGGRLDGS